MPYTILFFATEAVVVFLRLFRAAREPYIVSNFRLPHFSSQTFSVAVPTDKTVRGIIAPFTLPIFMARHRLIVRTSSVRQILERLFDFVILHFDTSS